MFMPQMLKQVRGWKQIIHWFRLEKHHISSFFTLNIRAPTQWTGSLLLMVEAAAHIWPPLKCEPQQKKQPHNWLLWLPGPLPHPGRLLVFNKVGICCEHWQIQIQAVVVCKALYRVKVSTFTCSKTQAMEVLWDTHS